jgi:hypothetical protein
MPAKRPGLLTTIAILGIVLGALGVLSSLGNIATLVFQDQIADLQGMAELPEAQREFTEQIREFTRAYDVPGGIGALANFVTSVLLILGGAMVLARKQSASGVMMYTLIASIVVDVYNTGLAAIMQVRMMPLMEEMTREMTAGNAGMESVLSAAQWAGLAFAAFWLVCKLGYYSVALVALKRPAARAWFAGETDM